MTKTITLTALTLTFCSACAQMPRSNLDPNIALITGVQLLQNSYRQPTYNYQQPVYIYQQSTYDSNYNYQSFGDIANKYRNRFVPSR